MLRLQVVGVGLRAAQCVEGLSLAGVSVAVSETAARPGVTTSPGVACWPAGSDLPPALLGSLKGEHPPSLHRAPARRPHKPPRHAGSRCVVLAASLADADHMPAVSEQLVRGIILHLRL